MPRAERRGERAGGLVRPHGRLMVDDPSLDAPRALRRAVATPWLLALGFTVLVLIGITSVLLVERARQSATAANHALEVENAIATIQLMLRRAESGQRGYLLTGNEAYLATYRGAIDEILPALEHVRGLAADNAEQQRMADEIDGILANRVADMKTVVQLFEAGDVIGAIDMVREGRGEAINQQLAPILIAMKAEERRLADERRAALGQASVLLLVVNLAGLLLIILLATLAILQSRRSTAALAAAGEQLRDANENLEAIVTERTADLIEANEEIQRFAYIVSHDLRAPLVNIMGFTSELGSLRDEVFEHVAAARRAAGLEESERDHALAHDVDEALGFIKTSIAKMDRLIHAILKISRDGRRRYRPETVDMTAMVGAIVASIEHQVQEAGATVTVGRLPHQMTDRLAIEQVFTNLVDNAVKYLRPDVPGEIRIECTQTPLRNVYTVADNGRGIAEKDRERVFELFRRAGAQDTPGEGIGLAHVRTLVRRLGGTIEIRSTPGAGSTFTITLPRTWTGPRDDDQGAGP